MFPFAISGFEDFNSNWSSAYPRDSKQHRISKKHSRIFFNRWVILWSVFFTKCDSKSSNSCQEQKSCYNLMEKQNLKSSFSRKESVRLNDVHSNEMKDSKNSLHNDSERNFVLFFVAAQIRGQWRTINEMSPNTSCPDYRINCIHSLQTFEK